MAWLAAPSCSPAHESENPCSPAHESGSPTEPHGTSSYATTSYPEWKDLRRAKRPRCGHGPSVTNAEGFPARSSLIRAHPASSGSSGPAEANESRQSSLKGSEPKRFSRADERLGTSTTSCCSVGCSGLTRRCSCARASAPSKPFDVLAPTPPAGLSPAGGQAFRTSAETPSLDCIFGSCPLVADLVPAHNSILALGVGQPLLLHRHQQAQQQLPLPACLLADLLHQEPALLLLQLQQEQQVQLQQQQQQQTARFLQQQQLAQLQQLGQQQQLLRHSAGGGLSILQPAHTVALPQPLHHPHAQQQPHAAAWAQDLAAAHPGLHHHARAPAAFTLHTQMMSLPLPPLQLQLQAQQLQAPPRPLQLPLHLQAAPLPRLQAPSWRGSCVGGGAEDWIVHAVRALGLADHPDADAARLALHCWRRVEGLPQLHHAARMWPSADAGRQLYATVCLWIATKLEVKRCQAPGGVVLAHMASTTTAALRSGELAVMNWLGWRPYEGYTLDDSHLLVFM